MMADAGGTKGSLLLVIPPVVFQSAGALTIDGDFANNLAAYLKHFDTVTVACPAAPMASGTGLVNATAPEAIPGHERARFVVLPWAYREDRYYRHLAATRRLLRDEIARADYLLFSPHAAFEWSTLAARLALAAGRAYDMEGDWNLADVSWMKWRELPWGPNKLRKYFWITAHLRIHHDLMRRSSVALLQGGDVYEAYKDIAPNPQKVLNVQVAPEDHIDRADLEAKLAAIRSGAPLAISYAGRAADMKGPFDWIDALTRSVERGVKLQATWFGEGELLDEMRARVDARGLAGTIALPGKVDRADALAAIRRSAMFLFCHKTAESPRCLVEALTSAAPIVGYGSHYARDLVAERGGGAFVEVGDWQGLADTVVRLDRDRTALATLVEQAHQTAGLYDRDAAIERRIELIRRYVTPPDRAA